MRGRTITIDTEVSVDIDLSGIDAKDLQEELRHRGAIGGGVTDGMTLLQRIVWEHDVLGLPLAEVVDGIMHENAVVRGSASAAMAGVD